MDDLSLPALVRGESCNHTADADPSRTSPLILRFVSWCVIMIWRTCVDWSAKRPFLTRATAHLSIIILTLTAIVLSGVGIPAPRAAMGGAFGDGTAFPSDRTAPAGPQPTPLSGSLFADLLGTGADVVARLPIPHTTIPERARAKVITYAVQVGDTIFDIAIRFGLSPDTIVWSNSEGIKGAPWLIQPGLELFILPVDGVYHTVQAGETIASIAADYEIEPAALCNEWNELEEGDQPQAGQLLIVPGGKGEDVDWTPPPLYPRPGPAGLSYGVCRGTAVSGPGANGWFVLPTGSPRVSGWYFHDPRNPTHIGLDYACRTGDTLYAADSGVVTVAGWNGGYGILVEINHGNGFVTRYGHLSELAVGCGQPIYQGQVIGYCGSTGWSTGSHLHFEIRSQGIPQDPQAYLP